MDFGRDSGEFGQEKWRIWPTMIWYNGISWRCIMDSKIKILLSLDFYVVWRVILLNHTPATQSLIVDDHLPWTGNPILNPSIFEGWCCGFENCSYWKLPSAHHMAAGDSRMFQALLKCSLRILERIFHDCCWWFSCDHLTSNHHFGHFGISPTPHRLSAS